jgi:hypothetical protein
LIHGSLEVRAFFMLLILILPPFQIIRCFGFLDTLSLLCRYIVKAMYLEKTRREYMLASAELQKFYVMFILCLIVSSGFGKICFKNLLVG